MEVKNIISLLKAENYIKNTVVFIPILFSLNFIHPELWLEAFIVFAAFCFISSSVYILNDLADYNEDIKHPVKSLRVIASGRVSKSNAVIFLVVLFILAVSFALIVNYKCVFIIFVYFLMNVFYSYGLKNIEIIDAVCIAFGFILRLIAGCMAIGVLPSPLIILLTFFLSLFFTFMKRKLELQNTVNESDCRISSKNFNEDTLKQFIIVNAVLSIAFYFTYVLDEITIQRAGTHYLYLTVVPFSILIYRLLFLVNTIKNVYSPIYFIYKDKMIKWLALSYIVVLLTVMLFLK